MPADPPGMNVIGYLSSEKGLGEAARGLVRAARAAGVPVATNDFQETESANRTPLPAADRVGVHYPVNLLAVNVDNLPNLARNVDLRRLRRGRHTVGYWFWEQPEFPPDWAYRFALVDEVWVGSTFTQQAVAAASPVPVVVVPPAVDPNPPAAPVTKSALGLPADAFVFLFVFDAASTLARKNPVGLVHAFRRAFPSEPGVRLVLKTSRLDACPADDRAELLAAVAADPRVVLLGGVAPRATITGLLAAADCYVSLHRAEGFGLTVAEAMVQGKPVVATGYSGTLDFTTPWNSLPVDYHLTRLDRQQGPYRAGLAWADPDPDDAADRMRWVVRNRAAAAQLGARGRADILARFRPEAVGATIAARLRQIAGFRVAAPPPAAGWEIDVDPADEVVAAYGQPGTVGVTVRDPLPGPAEAGVRVVGAWRTHAGDPLPGVPPVAAAVVPPADPPRVPVIYARVPFTPPDGPGDYTLDLEVQAAGGRRLAGPVAVPVRVTGRPGGDIDYRRQYATADLARDHWTLVGPATAAEFDRLGPVKLDMLVRAGLTPHARLLDVGCGTGQLAAAAERFLAADGAYHGTDVADEAVAFCRGRHRRPNFTFGRNDMTRLGLAGRAFDAVACFSVFTHTYLDESAALLADAAGLLAPGGFVFADFFVTPMARVQAGHRGAVEVNPDVLAARLAAVPLRAEEVGAEPWGRYARRLFFRMTRP